MMYCYYYFTFEVLNADINYTTYLGLDILAALVLQLSLLAWLCTFCVRP